MEENHLQFDVYQSKSPMSKTYFNLNSGFSRNAFYFILVMKYALHEIVCGSILICYVLQVLYDA